MALSLCHIPLKHFSHCICFISWLIFLSYTATNGVAVLDFENALVLYGLPITILVVLVKLLSLLALPQTLFNVVGLLFYDTFPESVTLNNSPLLSPFICVRVVTRYNYSVALIVNFSYLAMIN